MHPSIHAVTHPDKPAVVMADTGEIVTYAQMDAQSNQAAQYFRKQGLQTGDVLAFMLENDPLYYGLLWGAHRAGLHYVCLSTKLTEDEAGYIIENSGARLLVVSASLAKLASSFIAPADRYAIGGDLPGFKRWENAVATMPIARVADETAGASMLYSSGTTGRPKEIGRAHV